MTKDTISNETETKKIMNFIAHCNQFIAGKYLFATTKIKEIFEDVNSSSDLSMLKDECLDGFNLSLFKTKSLIKLPTKKGTFTTPPEKEDFLALAFSFVDEISTGVVDYDNFVNKYFLSEKNEDKFAKQVIEPLKILVSKLFDLPEDNETEYFDIDAKVPEKVIKIDNSEAINIAKNIINVIGEKCEQTQDDKNIILILLELVEALSQNQKSEIVALGLCIGYIKDRFDMQRYLFDELQFCLDKIK